MATVTFIKYAKQSAGALGGVAAYIAQANKTMQENGRQLVSGQNCNAVFSVRSGEVLGCLDVKHTSGCFSKSISVVFVKDFFRVKIEFLINLQRWINSANGN